LILVHVFWFVGLGLGMKRAAPVVGAALGVWLVSGEWFVSDGHGLDDLTVHSSELIEGYMVTGDSLGGIADVGMVKDG